MPEHQLKITAGTLITIDETDPQAPIISSTGADGIPTYGELYLSEYALHVPDSVIVDPDHGTITAGDVTSTQYIDGQYLTVQEAGNVDGKFTVDFTFTGITDGLGRLVFNGRYVGNTAHEVEVLIWNYNTSTWDNINATTKDIPHSTTDATYRFNYPTDTTNYVSNGEAQVRIYHTSNSVSSHYLYVDRLLLIEKSVTITTQGTWYPILNMNEGLVNDMTTDATNGHFIVGRTGVYKIIMDGSITGTPNLTAYGHIFVNGVEVEKIGAKRLLNATGDLSNLPMSGLLDLTADDEVDVRITGDIANSFVSFQYLNVTLTRIK